MSKVETLKGPIDSSALGFTLMHEHLLANPEGLIENFPSIWNRDEVIASAREQLNELYRTGVQTIVDQTILGLGRNIRLVLEIAEDLPINVVVTTGIYPSYDNSLHYLQAADIDLIADLFVKDITEGIQETKVKAGLVKAGWGERGMTPSIEKYTRAAARAHLRTGVPLVTHSESHHQQGLAQQDIFEQEGVDLTRVLIGHAGDSADIDYLSKIADRGSFLGMDRIMMESGAMLSIDERAKVISEMCERGYSDQMIMSHDSFAHTTIFPWELFKEKRPNWGYHPIKKYFIPALLELGVSQSQIDQMMIENPRRIFENQKI